MRYIEFDAQGRITAVGWATYPPPGAIVDVLDVGADVRAATHYVSAGVIEPRPVCPVGITAAPLVATLTGIPLGATLLIAGPADGAVVQDDPDGAIEVTAPIAGRYTFAVELFPARAFRTTVDL